MIFNRIITETEKQEQILKIKQHIQIQKEKNKQKIKNHNEYIRNLRLYNKKNINFNLKDEYDTVIPLNFYTCWHTKKLPPLMDDNYNRLIKQNPEFNFNLFDENDCREFIKDNFVDNVLNAYDKLLPCAYKADLWRYCVLYINGGIYMDIKYSCTNNFKLIALTEKEYFVRDRPIHTIYNALIVVKPQNPIMLNCIYKIVENIRIKYYGSSCLSPTGPGLLGSFFSLEEINNMEIFFTNTLLENNINEDYMVYKNIIILKYYNGYRKEQSTYQKNKPYGCLWDERIIYN